MYSVSKTYNCYAAKLNLSWLHSKENVKYYAIIRMQYCKGHINLLINTNLHFN